MDKGKLGFATFVILYIIYMIIRIPSGVGESGETPDEGEEIIIDNNKTLSHSLSWKDTEDEREEFRAAITIDYEDYYNSKEYKESYWIFKNDLDSEGNQVIDIEKLESDAGVDFLKNSLEWNMDVSSFSTEDPRWEYVYPIGRKEGYAYKKSHVYEVAKLQYIYSVFDKIRSNNTLQDYEFATMIVSFVQNLEYSLPMPMDCNRLQDVEGLEWALDLPCDSYVPFGWYAPTEFIGKWKGDCDTRTLFLFTVFQHYGYDVVILNSDMYSHSILGISLNPEFTTNPSYKEYRYKKYYAWEVTSPWPLGMLPASVKNMRYWNVVLDNNLYCPSKPL